MRFYSQQQPERLATGLHGLLDLLDQAFFSKHFRTVSEMFPYDDESKAYPRNEADNDQTILPAVSLQSLC